MIIDLKPRPKLSRFKFNGVSKREADKLREEAEVEHKVLENRHRQKISNLVNQNSNE